MATLFSFMFRGKRIRECKWKKGVGNSVKRVWQYLLLVLVFLYLLLLQLLFELLVSVIAVAVVSVFANISPVVVVVVVCFAVDAVFGGFFCTFPIAIAGFICFYFFRFLLNNFSWLYVKKKKCKKMISFVLHSSYYCIGGAAIVVVVVIVVIKSNWSSNKSHKRIKKIKWWHNIYGIAQIENRKWNFFPVFSVFFFAHIQTHSNFTLFSIWLVLWGVCFINCKKMNLFKTKKKTKKKFMVEKEKLWKTKN